MSAATASVGIATSLAKTLGGTDKICGKTVTVTSGGQAIPLPIDNLCDTCGENDLLVTFAGQQKFPLLGLNQFVGVDWSLSMDYTPPAATNATAPPAATNVTTTQAPPASNNTTAPITSPEVHKARIIKYDPTKEPNACKIPATAYAQTVGLPKKLMDSTSNKLCGTSVTILHNGKTYIMSVTNVCDDCGDSFLLVTNAAYAAMLEGDTGMYPVQWSLTPPPIAPTKRSYVSWRR